MAVIPHWICVKGLKQDSRYWRGLPDQLAERTGGVAVGLDLPGAGSLAGEPVPRDVDGMVRRLREVWIERRPDVSGPWGVLGLSLGGMVALRWGALFPEDLGGVVVGNTSAADLSPPWRRIRASKWPALVRAALPMSDLAREEHLVGLTSARALTSEDRRRWAREHLRWQREQPFGRRALVGQLQAAGSFRCPERLAVPALVLVGEGDRFVDPRCGHAVADRLGAQRRVHPTAGHDLSLDAPGWLVDTVADWAADPGPTPQER